MKVWHGLLIAVLAWWAYKLARPRVEAWRAAWRLRRPDRPRPFGAGLPWIAVRAADPRQVAEAIGLEALVPLNWEHGLARVRAGDGEGGTIFVSPPVEGWVLVVGVGLPGPVGRRFVDKCSPLLQALSKRFHEVHFYQADDTVDLYAWAKVLDGRVTRAFAIGDEGLIWNKGRLTREERGLGLKLFELRGVDDNSAMAVGDLFAYPTEVHVRRMAEQWSLDPTTLDRREARPGSGLVGRAPAGWRAVVQRAA